MQDLLDHSTSTNKTQAHNIISLPQLHSTTHIHYSTQQQQKTKQNQKMAQKFKYNKLLRQVVQQQQPTAPSVPYIWATIDELGSLLLWCCTFPHLVTSLSQKEVDLPNNKMSLADSYSRFLIGRREACQ
jgi:hypothetical protein